MEFVSWDDDIPNIWKNVPNHQPVICFPQFYVFVVAIQLLYM